MRYAVLLLLAFDFAVARQLPIRIYTTTDGLAGSNVKRIVRDSLGYLWFCTTTGLSRFDGHRFVNYGAEDGLPNDMVFDLLEERGGRWWVATHRGLAEFHPTGTPRFTLHDVDGKKNRSIRKLMLDRSGRLWVGTADGLFRAVGDGFTRVALGEPDEFAGAEFRALLEDRFGALWAGGRSGLYRRWPDGRVERYRPDVGLPYSNVEALLEDKTGRLWIGVRGGLFLVRNTRAERAVVETFWVAPRAVWALLEGSDGRLWAGNQDGFSQILVDTETSGTKLAVFNAKNGLHNSWCNALAEDLSGNLWIGTEGGAARVARSGFSTYAEIDGLASAGVSSVFESHDGVLQVVTVQRGAAILNSKQNERFVQIPVDLRGGTWTWGQIGLQSSRSGEWWFATANGLLRFPRTDRSGQLARLPPRAFYQRQHGLAGDSITVLFGDSHGDVWFQSIGRAEMGWHRWEAATESLRSYSAAEIGLLAAQDLKVLAEDRTGNIWLGFGGTHRFGGTHLVRYRDGHFRVLSGRDGLPAGSIVGLHCDRAGRVWAGSSEHGLLRIDNPAADQLQVVSYARPEGLTSNSVSAITEDRWGRIYAATGRGIDRLDPATGRIEHFSTANGLPSEIVYHAFRDRHGTLWFATGEGLARFDPEPPARPGSSAILVSAVRIRGVSQPVSELGQSSVSLPNLPATQNQIQIDFASLNFDPAAVVSYQYRLLGADRDWSSPTAQRTVNYASLKPGGYQFQVRTFEAGEPTDFSLASVASVQFTIIPPVWARWWFRAAAAFMIGLSIYGLHRYRVRYLLALERVRMQIAADLHDDIGASLTQIAVLSEVARSRLDGGGGQAVAPLAEIAGISGQVMDSISDMVWVINPTHDRLSDLVSRVRRFAGDILGARDIALQFRAPEGGEDPLLSAEARREFLLIAKEAIHNVARHSGATEVCIEFALGAHWLELQVRDNGRGFQEGACRQGNGLVNMRGRAAALGGLAELYSAPGKGTVVKVTAGF